MNESSKKQWVHKYKGFNIVRTGTKEYPYNVYKDDGHGFGTHVGYGRTMNDCKHDIDSKAYDESMQSKSMNESKETDKLYKAISDTADAIDDLDDKNEKSAKKNLDSADDKISDVKDNLKEDSQSKIVKVDKDKLKDYFLHFGGLGDVDKENIGDTAELLGYSNSGKDAIIRFNNRKDFNFKYRVPREFISESLKESLSEDVGVAALFNDLIQREYELLSEYESAQVTLEDHSVVTFDDIFDYIKDDINIHIGMLEAALEDINPSSEKTEEGKEQGETLLLDESLFE